MHTHLSTSDTGRGHYGSYGDKDARVSDGGERDVRSDGRPVLAVIGVAKVATKRCEPRHAVEGKSEIERCLKI